MNDAEQTLDEALAVFDFGAPEAAVGRFGRGHVNDTFCVRPVSPQGRCFILQRLSAAAFRRPDQVMVNVIGVTEYLREKIAAAGGDPSRETLEVLRTRSGAGWYTDRLGGVWRAFPFIRDACSLPAAGTPEVFAASGRAFGRFQRLMDGYPAGALYETIPRFHDTVDRLAKLRTAAAADPLGRAGSCAAELTFALEREGDCSVALDAHRRGELPLRVTHNDAKLDNVLFDTRTGEAVCVIDLDTVMPGLAINDFGDSIRSGANRCAEDERDQSRVRLDVELFAAYTAAFLEGAGGILTPAEIEYLPWGARLMTLECGIRFLTDYLEGDVYFRTERPGQNLDRARTQFTLVRDMEARWKELNAIVRTAGGI